MDVDRARPDTGATVTAPTTAKRSPALAWTGYAACAWAVLFAALSFYWAAGGTAGVEMNAPAITRPVLARDPGWIAILWITGALKLVAGLLALALVRPWGRLLPRWLLLGAGWTAFAIMALYEGAASLLQHALMVTGAIATPAGLGETSARWHLFLWDPWWLLGGLLVGLAIWQYQRERPALPGR
jgi:hypothetical protein